MENTELRIGNIVGIAGKVNPVNKKLQFPCTVDAILFKGNISTFTSVGKGADFEPIPLTEEWLLKLPKSFTYPKWIKHVHTLQNWYWVNNKCEKELVLK